MAVFQSIYAFRNQLVCLRVQHVTVAQGRFKRRDSYPRYQCRPPLQSCSRHCSSPSPSTSTSTSTSPSSSMHQPAVVSPAGATLDLGIASHLQGSSSTHSQASDSKHCPMNSYARKWPAKQ